MKLKNIAKTRLLDLYKIAISDGALHQDEYHLIIDIANRIGLSEDDALDIINGNINFEIQEPININDRMQHLFQMLFLMKIDGKIDPKEIVTIKNIVLYLGLNLDMIDDMIKLVSKYKSSLIPESEMIILVRKYMN